MRERPRLPRRPSTSSLRLIALVSAILAASSSAEGMHFTSWSFGMNLMREGHSGVPLGNGTVLFFGGRLVMQSRYLNDVWRFNTTWVEVVHSATWTPRAYACASTLQNDGNMRVVMVGGHAGGGEALGEVWSSSVRGRMWSQLAGGDWAARYHAACATTDSGRMVVAGGIGGSGSLLSSVYWTSDGASWQAASAPGLPRMHSAAMVAVANGWLALLGGVHSPGEDAPSLWVSKDDGRTWDGDPAHPPWAATEAVRLASGEVLAVNGTDDGPSVVWLGSADVSQWSRIADPAPWGRMSAPSLCPFRGGAVMAGTPNRTGAALTWITPSTSRGALWYKAVPSAIFTPRAFAAAAVTPQDSDVILLGGSDSGDQWRSLDASNGNWIQANPKAITPRWQHAMAFTRRGDLVVAGGRDSNAELISTVLADRDLLLGNPARGQLPRPSRLLSLTPLHGSDTEVLALGGLGPSQASSGPLAVRVNASVSPDSAGATAVVSDVLCGAASAALSAQQCVPSAVAHRWGHTATVLTPQTADAASAPVLVVLDGGGPWTDDPASPPSGRAWAQLADGTWKSLPDPSWTPRWGHAAVAVNSPGVALVVSGGQELTTHHLSSDVCIVASLSDLGTVQCYTAGWAPRRGHVMLTQPRSLTGASSSTLFVIGGDVALPSTPDSLASRSFSLRGEPSPEVDAKNDVWMSLNEGKSWQSVQRTSTSSRWPGRVLTASAVLSTGEMVATGGMSHGYARSDVWASPADSLRWFTRLRPAEWPARAGHAMVALANDDLVMLGGANESAVMSDVWRSRDGGRSWRLSAHAPWPARAGHACVRLHAFTILLAGGIQVPFTSLESWVGSRPVLGDVWRSADGGISWVEVQPVSPRVGAALLAIPQGPTLLIGGGSPDGLIAAVLRSDDEGDSWQAVTPSQRGKASHVAFGVAVYLPHRKRGEAGEVLYVGGYAAESAEWRPGSVGNAVFRISEEGAHWTRLASPPWNARWGHFGHRLPTGAVVLGEGADGDGTLSDVWEAPGSGSYWHELTYSARHVDRGALTWSMPRQLAQASTDNADAALAMVGGELASGRAPVVGSVIPQQVMEAGESDGIICTPPWSSELLPEVVLSIDVALFPEASLSTTLILGGVNRISHELTNAIYRGAPHACTWERVQSNSEEPRWGPRREFAATSAHVGLGLAVLVYGGVDRSGRLLNDLWASDALANSWRCLDTALLPHPVAHAIVWPLPGPGQFGIGGGLTADYTVSKAAFVARQDGLGVTAQRVADLDEPRYGAYAAAFIDGVICLVGGLGPGGRAPLHPVSCLHGQEWAGAAIDDEQQPLGTGYAATTWPGTRRIIVVGGSRSVGLSLVRDAFVTSPHAGQPLPVGIPAPVQWRSARWAESAEVRCSNGTRVSRLHVPSRSPSLAWTPQWSDAVACGLMQSLHLWLGLESNTSLLSGPLYVVDRMVPQLLGNVSDGLAEGGTLRLSVTAANARAPTLRLVPQCNALQVYSVPLNKTGFPTDGTPFPVRLHSGYMLPIFSGNYKLCVVGDTTEIAQSNCNAQTIQVHCRIGHEQMKPLPGCPSHPLTQCRRCPGGKVTDGRSKCRGCPRGAFASADQSHCEECPTGKYGAQAGASSETSGCTACPPGYKGTEAGAQSQTEGCQPCPAGTYSLTTGTLPTTVCRLCAHGFYNPNAKRSSPAACVPCGSVHTTTLKKGATSPAQCVCKPDFFALAAEFGDPSGPGKFQCKPCEPQLGLSCEHAGSNLTNTATRPGFWRWKTGIVPALPCQYSKACTGGPVDSALVAVAHGTRIQAADVDFNHTQCARGHGGPLCQVCLAGFGRIRGLTTASGLPCEECTAEAARRATAVIIVTVAVGTSAFILSAWSFLHRSVLRKACPSRFRSVDGSLRRAPRSQQGLQLPERSNSALLAAPKLALSPDSRTRGGLDAPLIDRASDETREDEAAAAEDSSMGKKPWSVFGEQRDPAPLGLNDSLQEEAATADDHGLAAQEQAPRRFLRRVGRRGTKLQARMTPLVHMRHLLSLWQLAILTYAQCEDYAPVQSSTTVLGVALSSMRWLNLDAWASIPLNCVIPGYNFYGRLLGATAMPLGAILLLVLVDRVLRAYLGIRRTGLLRFALVVLLFVYPGMVLTLMEVFTCEDFGDVSRLHVDLSLPCHGPLPLFVAAYAGLLLVFLVVVLPLLLAWLLSRAKSDALACSPPLATLPSHWDFLRPLVWGTRIEWVPLEALVMVRNAVTVGFFVFLLPPRQHARLVEIFGEENGLRWKHTSLMCATLWNLSLLAFILNSRPYVVDSLHRTSAVSYVSLQVCLFASALRLAGKVELAQALLTISLSVATVVLGYSPLKLFLVSTYRSYCSSRRKRPRDMDDESRRDSRSQSGMSVDGLADGL